MDSTAARKLRNRGEVSRKDAKTQGRGPFAALRVGVTVRTVGARLGLALALVFAAGPACDEATAPIADTDAADVATAADGLAPADTAAPEPVTEVPGGDAIDELTIGEGACCIGLTDGAVVWAEGGDIWLYTLATGARRAVVDHPATQKDPVLHDGLLVWADDRGGDFDLWAMELPSGEPTLLVGGAGDQDEPTVHSGRVAWIGRTAAPHDAHAAEVWVMTLGEPGSAHALTDDAYEQTQPHLNGDRVVWADFRAASEGVYVNLSDPVVNNADIYGHDLATDEGFVVTTDPSKQLRPAIEGDEVVWLDWRGINPEPKYSEFQVYARRLGEPDERRLAWSAWTRPELWQRPALRDGVVAWVAEPATTGGAPGSDVLTEVFAVRLDGGEPWRVASSRAVLEAVVLGADARAAWLGGGTLGVARVEAIATPGR